MLLLFVLPEDSVDRSIGFFLFSFPELSLIIFLEFISVLQQFTPELLPLKLKEAVRLDSLNDNLMELEGSTEAGAVKNKVYYKYKYISLSLTIKLLSKSEFPIDILFGN